MRSHQFEVAGTAYIYIDGVKHECTSAVTYTHTGAEVWLYVDDSTGELLKAERIDGDWTDIDIDEAREEFSDVIYCI